MADDLEGLSVRRGYLLARNTFAQTSHPIAEQLLIELQG
jgi:hypothetical protein